LQILQIIASIHFSQKDAIFLVLCYMPLHVEGLACKVWRGYIYNTNQPDNFDRKLPRLKEATTVLELALGS
jgi:hypothetical protein